MSLTIMLTAQANATLHLSNGEERRYLVEENIPLNETPTEVTNIILGFKTHEEKLAAYKGWILETFNKVADTVTWDDGDTSVRIEVDLLNLTNTIIVGDTVRPETRTMGELIVKDLDDVLQEYESWDFEWSWS